MLASVGIDPQGCLDVTCNAARRFHDRNPLPYGIPCFCVAGAPEPEAVCWPLRRPHAALSQMEGPNDGLVSVESANAFGTPLPIWPADHLRQMNWLAHDESAAIGPTPLELYARVVAHLAALGFGDRRPPGLAYQPGVPRPRARRTDPETRLAGRLTRGPAGRSRTDKVARRRSRYAHLR